MGFYGNITNTNRTQFVFDKIYSNRAEMETACATGDGVYIGRYVLVDYDEGGTEFVVNPSEAYSKNFEVDDLAYGYLGGKHIGIGRGWDSTVWQKTYNDGVETYVSVAELNGVVPTFDLTIDAPSLEPIKPHFDADSTNMYYKLHVQPTWGFKVAEAKKNAPSDTDIVCTTRTWNPDSQKYETKWINYKGNIHFNKAGFDSSTGFVTENNDNKIYTSFGQSGRKYNDTHYYKNENGEIVKSYLTAAKDDIQELNIELPGLGNAVATMWDIVYGKNAEGQKRNQSIDWNDISGNRLVSAAADGNGYAYDTEKVETLAGCINSVHDLMGMIIEDDDTTEVDKALSNHIYYRGGKFYIKNLTYEYNEDDSEKSIELSSFTNDIYYQDSMYNLYRESKEDYDSNNYYYKIPAGSVIPKEFTDEVWLSGKFYYKDENGDLVIDEAENPTEGRTYYKISYNQATTIKVYNNYTLGSATNKSWCFMPGNYSEEVYNKVFPETDSAGLFYYAYDGLNGAKTFKKYSQTDETCRSLPISTEFVYVDGYEVEWSTEVGSNKQVATYDMDKATLYDFFRMIEFEEGKFYSYDDETREYVLLQSLDDVSSEAGGYYYFSSGDTGEAFTEIDKPFYYSKRYYYIDGDNFIYGATTAKLPGKQYVELPDLNSVHYVATFYEPNKYYYRDDIGAWHLDTNEDLTAGRTYYLDTFTKYVMEDTSGNLAKGMVWTLPDSVAIPDSVTLGVRTEKYEWKELKGFARTLNTIHGLILNINNLLKVGDTLTRDTSTVQGCINTLNDMIRRFDTLLPGTAIINQYGQIASATAVGDSWLAYTVDPAVQRVTLQHKNPVVSSYTKKSNATLKFGESFTFEDHWFDAKGHKYATEARTITLPSGSLTDATKSGSDVITQLSFNSSTGAIGTTRENVSGLKLNGFTLGSDRAVLASTDTIGGAFSKLQNQITDEVAARSTAIDGVNSSLIDETTARTNAINEVSSNLANEVTARENAINEVNGSITTINETLANTIQSSTKFSYNINEGVSQEKTIQEMFDYIVTLEKRIAALESSAPETPVE